MTVGSVTGAHQSIRPVPLSGASAPVASSSHKDMTSGEAATKSHPEQSLSLSKAGKTSPSAKVMLSHSSDKGQPTQPLTYHKVYRSQPFNTLDPNTVKYELVKDKPGASHNKDGVVSASEKTKGKDSVKSDKTDKPEDPGKLKALAYGAIGIDSDDAKGKESGYYNAGQFLKTVGTIGGLVALFV